MTNMDLQYWELTAEDLQVEINKAKNIFLEKMLDERIISEEMFVNMQLYSILVQKPSALGNNIRQLFENENNYNFIVAKLILETQDELEENDRFFEDQKSLLDKIDALQAEVTRLQGELIANAHQEESYIQTSYSPGHTEDVSEENRFPEVNTDVDKEK
jgi:cell division septum initiation protein DivIVA